MSEDESFFFGMVRTIIVLGAVGLGLLYGTCEIAHRWEARAPERNHPEPCQDSAIEVDDASTRRCPAGATGTLEVLGGKAVWVCRCARDGGAKP